MVERCQGGVQMDGRFAETLFYGAEKEHLEVATVDRELRDRVAGALAAGLGQDRVAMAVVEVEFLGFDGSLGECVQETQIPEYEDCGRLDVDTDTKRC